MAIFRNSNGPRRELRRKDYALRGVIGLIVVSVIGYFLNSWATGAYSSEPKVTATLDNIGASITEGSDVKLQGVLVGKVSKVRPTSRNATLELTMNSDSFDGIPSNVVARVLPATVFGTSFVDLTTNGGPAARSLKNGARIPQDETQETIEFQRALDDIDGLVKALGPAELANALGAIAQALDGRGEQLGETFDLANSLLTRVNGRMPLIRSDVRLLAQNMEILEKNAPDLLAAVNDGLVTLRTIVEQKGQLTALLTGGMALVSDAETFIDRRGEKLVQAIRQARVLVDATYDYRQAGVVDSFHANTKLSRALPKAESNGQLFLSGPAQADMPPYYTDCPRYGTLRGRC